MFTVYRIYLSLDFTRSKLFTIFNKQPRDNMKLKYQFKNAFDTIMIDQLAGIPEGAKILVYRLVFTAILLAEKYEVHFVTDDPEAKNLFDQTICGNGEFGNDDKSYLIEPAEVIVNNQVINKKENGDAWFDWCKRMDKEMKFHVIIANPPYAYGNKIISETIKHLTDDGKAVVIQPWSQYKSRSLFEYIEFIELADPQIFENADITSNLNISVLNKDKIKKYSYDELDLQTCNQNYIKYYAKNIELGKKYFMRQIRDDEVRPENIDLHHHNWFIENIRCSSKHKNGFGTESTWYKWNMNGATGISNAFAGVIEICGKALENFKQWWYYKPVGKGLASIVIAGINKDNFVGTGYYALPQIKWETIDQHPLWNTDVDAAVLDVMGLKWNEDKTVIIDK